MGWKEKYIRLALMLYELGCFVMDSDYLGYCLQTDNIKAVIYIRSSLSWKHKLYTLAHETGHLFRVSPEKPLVLNWTKMASEEKANARAIEILKLLEVDRHGYTMFYNEIKLRNKKKSWHQYN